jgi:hypothetical protein
MKFSETNLANSGLKNKYNTLDNNQKARFRNFRNRFMARISYQNIYNQIMREKEHKYTPSEKSLVHHFMKTQNMTAIQAHNKILKLRKPVVAVFPNAAGAYQSDH